MIVCCTWYIYAEIFGYRKNYTFCIYRLLVCNQYLPCWSTNLVVVPLLSHIPPLCLFANVSHLVSLLVQRCKPNITWICYIKWSYSRIGFFPPRCTKKAKRIRKKIHWIRICMHNNEAKIPETQMTDLACNNFITTSLALLCRSWPCRNYLANHVPNSHMSMAHVFTPFLLG